MKLQIAHNEKIYHLRPQFLSIFFAINVACLAMQEDSEAAQKMRSDIAKTHASPIWQVGAERHSREFNDHLEVLKKFPIVITKNGMYLLGYRGTVWSYYPPKKP